MRLNIIYTSRVSSAVNRQRIDERDAWAVPGEGEPRIEASVSVAPDWRPMPWSDGSSVRRRAGILAGVVVLHVALIASLLLLHGRDRGPAMVPPIQVTMINEAPHADLPAVPRPDLERPHVDVVMPELPSAAPTPDAPTAILAAPSAPPPAAPAEMPKPASTEPVTPPRFDAAYLKNPPPAYPAASRRMREQGTVVMRVRVSSEGNAAEVSIERSSGSPRLDEAAMEAVRHWRFVPAHRGAQSVEAWVLVPLGFELQR